MAYDFTSASSQHLTTGSTPVTSAPLTIACFAKASTLNVTHVLVSVDKTSDNSRFTLFLLNTDNKVYFTVVGSSGSQGVVQLAESSSVTSNTWFHAAGTISSSRTTRRSYLNGVMVAQATAQDPGPSSPNNISIGSRIFTTQGQFFDGLIAEVGIWNTDLTEQEVKSLAAGMTCDKVRPQSLVFYAPLVRDLIDAKGGLTITNNNTATVANHPRVYA
jgi:hypothetical protein